MTFTKRDVVKNLKHADLLILLDGFEVEVEDRRSNEQIIDALVRSKKLTLSELLEWFDLSELKNLCLSLGLDDTVKSKEVLIDRILQGATKTQTPKPKPSKSAPIEILTTFFFGRGLGELTLEAIQSEFAGAEQLCIVSAYYDTNFLNALLNTRKLPSSLKNVKIVFNRLRGPRLNQQRTELEALIKRLAKKVDIEIRLNSCPGIFHPKLYLMKSDGACTALVGSANATMASVTINEELMVKMEANTEQLEEYFDYVWEDSSALDEKEYLAKGLIPFFRTGQLFFRATTSLQISINPFSALLRSLPKMELKKLNNVTLPFAEPVAGVGPFDLKRALDLAEEDEEQVEKTSRARIKPYSIETCFGYWVPQALVDDLNATLKKATQKKRDNLDKLRNALEETTEEDLQLKYQSYTDAVADLFTQQRIDWKRYTTDLPLNPFESEDFLKKNIKRLKENLENETFVERLCAPYVSSNVPEIWSDPVATEDFEQSFFLYLEHVSGLQTWNKVPGLILETLNVRERTPADEIQELFERHLKDVGWHDQEGWNIEAEE